MRANLIEASVSALIRRGIINESDEEIYIFGVKGLYFFIVNIMTSIFIGALVGMLWQSILFSAAYIPLRWYAGGYHAKTPGRCYCLSVLFIVFALLIIKYVLFSWILAAVFLVISFSISFVKVPVESESKPLSNAEFVFYRVKARRILLFETVLSLLCILFLETVAKCIITAIFCSTCMLLIRHKK